MKNIVINSDKIKGCAEIVIKLIIIALVWKLMLSFFFSFSFSREIEARFANTICPVYPLLILSISYTLMIIRMILCDLKKDSFISAAETGLAMMAILIIAAVASNFLANYTDQNDGIGPGFVTGGLGMIGFVAGIIVSLPLTELRIFKSEWLKSIEHKFYKKLKF